MKKIMLIVAIITTTIITACKTKRYESINSLTGRIIAETAHTFTLKSDNDIIVFPKSLPIAYSNRFFMNDSVIVRYRKTKETTKVDDIILISHKDAINNVAELFVGSWNEADSDKTITLNADMTTSDQHKWLIDGKKFMIQREDGTTEYNIINIDDKQMTLCFEDKTIRMRRTYQN